MKNLILYASALIVFLTGSCGGPSPDGPLNAELKKTGEKWEMLVNGEPFYIKGAVGHVHLGLLPDYGANSIRAGYRHLDEADSLGLTVMTNLPVQPQRNGMDYDDPAAVKEQHEMIMQIVRENLDHPAVLMWSVGNELDYVGYRVPYNPKVWDAVSAIAADIKKIDPHHPVMTVIGTGRREKLGTLMERCPNLDLIGINTYKDMGEVRGWLEKYNWKKPYVISEWGPTGHWQVPETAWESPIEENSSEKADVYMERYEKYILGNPDKCLGSYVFLWGQKQERTHTWYGLFDRQGHETEAIDVMHYEWTGSWPINQAPRVISFRLEDQVARESIILESGRQYRAKVEVRDPDGDPLEFSWEILPEAEEFGYGGHGESKPEPVSGLFRGVHGPEMTFTTPAKEDIYLIYVHIYDNHNHFAYASIPFKVE